MTEATAQGKPEHVSATPAELVEMLASRAIMLAAEANRRVIIGLAGGPGSGKSTLAGDLVGALDKKIDGSAARVPMDGFHIRHKTLEERGLAAQKGAPATFDGEAFLAFLHRLKEAHGPVPVPSYSRRIEDVVPDAFTISGNVPILIVEGNYLLLPDPPWDGVKPLLDLSVFLDVPRDLIRARLLKRHAEHGLFSKERNLRHIENVDLPNYDLVAASAGRADVVVGLKVKG
jgi:pantothenate kinase